MTSEYIYFSLLLHALSRINIFCITDSLVTYKFGLRYDRDLTQFM